MSASLNSSLEFAKKNTPKVRIITLTFGVQCQAMHWIQQIHHEQQFVLLY